MFCTRSPAAAVATSSAPTSPSEAGRRTESREQVEEGAARPSPKHPRWMNPSQPAWTLEEQRTAGRTHTFASGGTDRRTPAGPSSRSSSSSSQPLQKWPAQQQPPAQLSVVPGRWLSRASAAPQKGAEEEEGRPRLPGRASLGGRLLCGGGNGLDRGRGSGRSQSCAAGGWASWERSSQLSLPGRNSTGDVSSPSPVTPAA